MASRIPESKDEDVEQQSMRLLQSDAATVRGKFNLKLTVLDLIEEGHKAAAVSIGSSLVIGFIMGMTLPVDHNIPERYARASNVLGWTYFACWWIGWYPQLIQNALLKNVAGISFDFMIYNWLGFFCYSMFNLGLYLNPMIRAAYRSKLWHPQLPLHAHDGQNSAVRVNDLAFSLHCNLCSTVMLAQIIIYPGDGQRVTPVCWASVGGFFVLCGGYLLGAGLHWPRFTALGFLYLLSYLKLLTSFVKYFPQVWLNYKRQSTIGWSVSNAMTDMSGGLFSLAQQSLDAYALKDMSIVTGDPVKFGLALVSIGYCVVLLVQHYVLYRERKPSHYATKQGLPEEPPQATSSFLTHGQPCDDSTEGIG